MSNRAGFSMIELIFAIVIIAISVMTIPLMLTQSSNNNSFSLMQESILAARTKMGNILTHDWDRNSVDVDGYTRVLDVQNGADDLNRSATSLAIQRRIGHIAKNKRRRFHNGDLLNKTFPSTVIDENSITNLNDFHQQNILVDANDTLDYLRDFNVTTKVFYISDKTNYTGQNITFDFDISSKKPINNVNNSTNIKMVELFVQSNDAKPFRLRAFSSNIGQTNLMELLP